MSDSNDSGHDAFAAMAATSAEHDLMKPFEGTFSATVKLWMGPGEPHVSTGVMRNEAVLGGRFLAQSYVGDPSEGPFPSFEGRGFWGYNKVDGVWEGVWIDTASTMVQFEKGSLDESGRVWTMHSEMTNPQDGQRLTRRSVLTLIDDDRHSMEMFFGTPAGESKSMEIQYVRRA